MNFDKYDIATLESVSEILSFIVNNKYEMSYNNFLEQLISWDKIYGFRKTKSIEQFIMKLIELNDNVAHIETQKYSKGFSILLNKKELNKHLRAINLHLIIGNEY